MIILAIMLLLAVGALTAVVYLLGFRLGGQLWQSRLTEIRLEGARAERDLHNLTRDAFIKMAEQIEHRRQSGQ